MFMQFLMHFILSGIVPLNQGNIDAWSIIIFLVICFIAVREWPQWMGMIECFYTFYLFYYEIAFIIYITLGSLKNILYLLDIKCPFIKILINHFMELACQLPNYVRNSAGECVEMVEKTSLMMIIIGCLILGLIAGLSSLAGLGGGGPSIVILIIFFDMMPKQATISVFACILGSSFGNLLNQMLIAFNNEPMIHYQYAFVVLPLMFIGSLIGVLLNRLLPSVVVVMIIIGVASNSLPKIINRYRQAHLKQTQQLLLHQQNERNSDIIKSTSINPFDDPINVKIFKQLLMLIIAYIGLILLRGSQKFPSFIGLASCSIGYWILQLGIFIMAFWFYKFNKKSLDFWTAPSITLGEQLFERVDFLQQSKKQLIQMGISAGIFSGFGLGGGIFLVPLFRHFKLNALQATATCTFTIFVTASINCIQAIFTGILTIKYFFFFFAVSACGSYFLSVFISNILRKANRLSCVQLLLVILLIAANINLPIGLWLRYVDSGHDLSVILGFGSIC